MQGQGNSLYDRLLAIKPDALSLNAWTVRAGVSRNFFNDVRRRGNANHDSLEKILDAAGISWAQFDAGDAGGGMVRSEVRGTGMGVADVRKAWRGSGAQRPVPLLGTAYGGEWSDGVEMTELHLTDALDYLARPDSVAGDAEAYAVEIVGDSMVPRYKPGERAIASPKAAVRPGDDVIVQLTNGPGEETSQVAGRVVEVLIKEMTKRTASFVELRQYNPPKTFQVPMVKVAAIHRVRHRF